jgi:hypothetical protein
MAGNHQRDKRGAPVGRRVVLGTFHTGIAGLVAAPHLQRGWDGFLGYTSEQNPTGITRLLPDPGGFPYYSVAGSVPSKDDRDYALRIDGLVDQPRTYTLPELRVLPQTRIVHDLMCTDGWRVDNTPFQGVRLADLLDSANCTTPGILQPRNQEDAVLRLVRLLVKRGGTGQRPEHRRHDRAARRLLPGVPVSPRCWWTPEPTSPSGPHLGETPGNTALAQGHILLAVRLDEQSKED